MILPSYVRFAVGPALVLVTGVILSILAVFGVFVPHNEMLLFTLVVFAGFYAGIGSGYTAVLVAATHYALILAYPGAIPDFTVHPWSEIVALGGTLPVIIIMVGLLRRRLDERVRESEDGYRTVVENIDEVFFVMSIDFKKLYYISPAYERIWGRPVAEFYAHPDIWRETIHPEDRDAVQEYISQLLAGTWPISRDPNPVRIVRPDKTLRWLIPKTIVLRNPDGVPDRFIGLARDITAEVTAKSSERQTYERFRAAMDNAPIALFSTDKDGILTLREGRGGGRAGVKPGQAIGTSYFEQFPDVPKHLENVRRALGGATLTDRLRVRDGFFEIVYAPLKNADGSIDGMIGIATDITERAEAEAKAQELSALKNKFITVVSHQLRTPLSAVRWNQEILLSNDLGPLNPEQRAAVRMSHEAANEVISLSNDFLFALDIEEGRMTLDKQPTSLEEIWRSVMTDMAKQCGIRGLTCTFTPPTTDVPRVLADPSKVRLVMEKLSDNALFYTPKGSIASRMDTRDGMVRFEIKDTGIGIPTAEQARLFHRFFRGSNAMSLRTDASGLGLYIAKRIVEIQGGTIGFTSTEGSGSTFWFELPVA